MTRAIAVGPVAESAVLCMDVKRQIGELRPVSHRCDDYVSGQLDGTCASDDQLSGQEKPTFSEFLEQCEDLLVHPALAPSEDWALLPAVVAVSNASAPAADSCRVESLNCHSCAEGLASLASQVLDQTLVSRSVSHSFKACKYEEWT